MSSSHDRAYYEERLAGFYDQLRKGKCSSKDRAKIEKNIRICKDRLKKFSQPRCESPEPCPKNRCESPKPECSQLDSKVNCGPAPFGEWVYPNERCETNRFPCDHLIKVTPQSMWEYTEVDCEDGRRRRLLDLKVLRKIFRQLIEYAQCQLRHPTPLAMEADIQNLRLAITGAEDFYRYLESICQPRTEEASLHLRLQAQVAGYPVFIALEAGRPFQQQRLQAELEQAIAALAAQNPSWDWNATLTFLGVHLDGGLGWRMQKWDCFQIKVLREQLNTFIQRAGALFSQLDARTPYTPEQQAAFNDALGAAIAYVETLRDSCNPGCEWAAAVRQVLNVQILATNVELAIYPQARDPTRYDRLSAQLTRLQTQLTNLTQTVGPTIIAQCDVNGQLLALMAQVPTVINNPGTSPEVKDALVALLVEAQNFLSNEPVNPELKDPQVRELYYELYIARFNLFLTTEPDQTALLQAIIDDVEIRLHEAQLRYLEHHANPIQVQISELATQISLLTAVAAGLTPPDPRLTAIQEALANQQAWLTQLQNAIVYPGRPELIPYIRLYLDTQTQIYIVEGQIALNSGTYQPILAARLTQLQARLTRLSAGFGV